MRQLRMMFYAAVVAAAIAPAVSGQDWNASKHTYLTFSGPVQVPGASLPAGTYMFRLADPISHRHMIQIRNKEGTQLFATLLSIPNQADKPKDDPFVMFLETPAGQPAAIKAWFYPGERTGYEFVYPKDQAMRIAKSSNTSVLAYANDVKSDSDVAVSSDSQVGRVDPQGRFVDDDQAVSTNASDAASTTNSDQPAEASASAQSSENAQAAPAPAPSANRTEPRAAVGTTGQRDTTGRTSTPAATAGRSDAGATQAKQLPRTASNLGLIQLLSGVSLVAALALRQRRRHAAESRA